jgi:D-threo-aldose 1-dehydrogenase
VGAQVMAQKVEAARISRLAFGAAPLGNLYAPVAEDEAQSALCLAFERGIAQFDTAPYYGYGLSEERLGRAFAGRPRESFTVSTKVGRRMERDESRRGPMNDGFAVTGSRAIFDYSRDGVRRSFEESLRRLGVDYVDILLLHDIGRLTHGDRHAEVLRQALDEALPAMAELREAGAVGAIGIGVNEQAVCLEVMPRFDLDCIMLAGRYTLLEQAESTLVMSEASRRGVRILVAAPYNSGLLGSSQGPGEFYNYAPVDAATLDKARRIYAEAATEGVDVGAAALQFPLAHPAVWCVVAGMRNASEVAVAAERMGSEIPRSLWERLRRVGLLRADVAVPGA